MPDLLFANIFFQITKKLYNIDLFYLMYTSTVCAANRKRQGKDSGALGFESLTYKMNH